MAKEKKLPETINEVKLAGLVVSSKVEYKQAKRTRDGVEKAEDVIVADVVLRTADGGEHEVGYFAYKLTKDNKLSGLFTEIETFNTLNTLEKDPNSAVCINAGDAQVKAQEYWNTKDGRWVMYNEIGAKFVNILSEKDLETKPLEAKFSVQGIVSKITDEVKQNVPTGNKLIEVQVLGYQGAIVPVKLTVMKDIVDKFMSAGFFEGGVAKFTGNILNTKITEEVVTEQAFGEDDVQTKTITTKRYEVKGGSPQGTIYELGLTDTDVTLIKSKRTLKLKEIKAKAEAKAAGGQGSTPQQSSDPFGASGSTPAPSQPSNPFA